MDRAKQERWALVICIIASAMAFIDGTALNIVLPVLQGSTGATATQLLWIVNAYAIPVSSLIILCGSLGDRYGTRRIFALGIALFTISSAVCGLVPSVASLIFARGVQGLGAALMIPLSLSFLSINHPQERRGQAIGTWSAFSAATTIIGPILGGFLAEAGLWRWIFFINIPLGIGALIALLTKFEPTPRPEIKSPLDVIGAVLISLALGAISYATIEWQNDLVAKELKVAGLSFGLAALVAFIWHERRTAHPMIPMQLFGHPVFRNTNFGTLLIYGALGGLLFFLPLNLVQIQGYAAAETGLTMLPFAIGISLLSPVAGRLADRFGHQLMIAIGTGSTGLGYLILSLIGITNGPSDYWLTYFPAIVVLAIGMGLTVAPLTSAVITCVTDDQMGVASGINNAVSRTAGVIAVAVFGAISIAVFRNELLDIGRQAGLGWKDMDLLTAQAINLGDATIPSDWSQAEVLTQGVRTSFVSMFQLLCRIAVAMNFIACGVALATIRSSR